MVVSKEQLMNGILTYADKEVMPCLPTGGKWGLGTFIVLYKSKADKILDELCKNKLFMSLDLVDELERIDFDRLSDAMIESANHYGCLEINVPILGKMKFSARDIELLKTYVDGGTL